MIPLLLLLAAPADTAIAALPGGDAARFAACARLAHDDPARAVTAAEEWARRGSGVTPGHCLGLAYASAGRWTQATAAFQAAAARAEADGDGRAASLWAQAGNAGIAADTADAPTAGRARADLDRALGQPGLAGTLRGEALLDRARADVALGDLAAARADLDRGRDLAAADPFAWLLSASLARRQHDLDRAAHDVAEAARLAPDDPAVALEAGNIAGARGDAAGARAAWGRAVTLGRGGPEGRAAAAALAANE